jgi:hypothetical protein
MDGHECALAALSGYIPCSIPVPSAECRLSCTVRWAVNYASHRANRTSKGAPRARSKDRQPADMHGGARDDSSSNCSGFRELIQ